MKHTFLIHGPWVNNCIDKIIKEINRSCVNKYKDNLEIIIVCYVADEKNIQGCIDNCGMTNIIHLVKVKDLFNPGFYNINRQIVTVKAGLESASQDSFVIKLRNDQIINIEKLMNIIAQLHYFNDDTRRFITTNCFTRKDRFYHPSDMFLAGWRNDLMDYYDVPVMKDTSAEYKMKMLQVLETNPADFQKVFRTPESYLFSNYLVRHGWKIKNTKEDSFEAVKFYFYVANSWDLDFCWNKLRSPWNERGHLILPMFGYAAPFGWTTPIRDENGELFMEEVACYERCDFEGNRTKEDMDYVKAAKEIYEEMYPDVRKR